MMFSVPLLFCLVQFTAALLVATALELIFMKPVPGAIYNI